jgi:ubiquitin-protein ligase
MGVSKGCIHVGSDLVCHPFVFPVDEEIYHWPVAMDEAVCMSGMLPFFYCTEDWSPCWMMEAAKEESK